MPKQSTLSGNSASKYSLENKQNPEQRAEFKEKLAKYKRDYEHIIHNDYKSGFGTKPDLV